MLQSRIHESWITFPTDTLSHEDKSVQRSVCKQSENWTLIHPSEEILCGGSREGTGNTTEVSRVHSSVRPPIRVTDYDKGAARHGSFIMRLCSRAELRE